MSAVGQQVFSYLPLGSLLNTNSSPIFVNITFHDAIFQMLGQATTLLNLSQCKHLRCINDIQLINLIQKIVEICHPEVTAATTTDTIQRRRRRRHDECRSSQVAAACSSSIKVTQLDLSRCRHIHGQAILYCLKHMPNIQRIILSSASRFDPLTTFTQQANNNAALQLSNKLQYIDISGCSKVDTTSFQSFISVLQPSKLLHLDLSGISSMINDEIFTILGRYCYKLESLSLAGATKVTDYGAGLISYICRDTLKSLNLRGCEKVHLPKLLALAAFDLSTLINDNVDNHQAILPPNYVRSHDTISKRQYYSNLFNSMKIMFRVVDDDTMADWIESSRSHMSRYKTLEQQWRESYWNESTDQQQQQQQQQQQEEEESPFFGKLEQLDISLIGNRSIRLEGCLATIAWLNGGRLRHVNTSGLDSVLQSDLAILASTSQENLQSLSTSASSIDEPLPPGDPSYHSQHLIAFFYSMRCRDLDLSHCQRFMLSATLNNLRSLKLDYNNGIQGNNLQALLATSTKLLRLSIRGCPNIRSNDLCLGKHMYLGDNQPPLGLLELDCRDINMSFLPLSRLREIYPRLLKLNNRLTPLGSKKIQAHRSNFLWRVGEEPKASRKRKGSGDRATTTTSTASIGDDRPTAAASNCCTILSTAFSQCKDTEQEMFACLDCKIESGHFVCTTCVKQCHEGHETYSVGSGVGYCDCCIFSSCKCL